MVRNVFVALTAFVLLTGVSFAAEGGTRLLRFPDIHGDTVAFCYGGDLWVASTDGGAARRLTAHPGQEVFPRFSPDGEWIAFHGHMACLISETSASDGDIFPHYFREAGLGPLIGKRTWGGVVGGGNISLLDGAVFVPRSATNNADGEYIIEGIGVEPDIEVGNDPALVIAGRDQQLERAVEEILKAIEAQPKSLPERPADPVKTPGAR